MNRRKLLKATGASITTIPLLGVTGAQESGNSGRSFEEHAAQARKIRKETGSQERFVKYHETHADHVTHNRWKKNIFRRPNTDEFEENEGKCEITVGYYLNENCGGENTAHIDMHVSVDGEYGDGEDDDDTITLSWNKDHYKYEQGSEYVDNGPNVTSRSHDTHGLSWDWDDASACSVGCDLSFSVGCYAEIKSTDQERYVQGKHIHTWEEATVTSVGFSSSGDVSVTISEQDKWKELTYEQEEEPFDAKGYC